MLIFVFTPGLFAQRVGPRIPDLGPAADYAVLAARDVRSITPTAVTGGAVGGLGEIARDVSFPGREARGRETVNRAINQLNEVREELFALEGINIESNLNGQSLGPGTYTIEGDARLGEGEWLSLRPGREPAGNIQGPCRNHAST